MLLLFLFVALVFPLSICQGFIILPRSSQVNKKLSFMFAKKSSEQNFAAAAADGSNISLNSLKNLFVEDDSKRGVIGHNLINMLDKAAICVKNIDIESTCPVRSQLFDTLMNIFVALDILSVRLTRIDNTQFSFTQAVDLKSAGCSAPVLAAFLSLQQVEFSGEITSPAGLKRPFSPWHLWSTYRHRGIGDVALLQKNGSFLLKCGKIEFPVNELENYIQAARDLVLLAAI